MRAVVLKLAGTVLAVALGAGVQAAPFRVVPDAVGSVWVLDARTGALDWCRTRAASGPKVVDVFGTEGLAREAAARQAVPVCTPAAGSLSAEARTLAAAGVAMRAAPGYPWRATYGGRVVSGGYPGGWGGYASDAPGVFGGIGSVDGVINILGSDDIDIDID